MMQVEIWKFELQPLRSSVKMPTHARVLSTAFQGGALMVWAVVVPSNVQALRTFAAILTGHPSGDAVGAFVGTAFHPAGLVFHVFDRGYDDDRARPAALKEDNAQ